MNTSVDRSGNRVGVASRSSESPKPRTDGRTDGLTKNLLTERTSGTFRNAHTRVPDSAAVEVAELAEPPDYEALWRDAIAAVRLLGSEVRRRDAEVRRLRAELEER